MRSSFSLSAIGAAARDTVRRFPIETIVAVLGTIVALVLINFHETAFIRAYQDYVQAAIFAAPMLLAVQLAISILREGGGVATPVVVAARIVASALAAVVIITIDLVSDAAPVQILTLGVTSHALTALAAFRRGALATWNFNRALFLRMCLALVFTGVLTGGLMTAVGALDVLFGIDVEPEYYGSIAALSLGLFNTVFVLAGVPTTSEDDRSDLPVSLRWFVQFVLIPLVGVFLIILYAYGIKVVFFSDLEGAVANYILSMGVASLLAWVLAWPMRDDPEHRFVSFYMRWLGPVMIPMAALLITAIGIRIAAYGITPPRFAVAALASFFTLTVVYLSVRRVPDLRMIPAVLCVIGAITALGPLGSVQVTVRDQTTRATKVLTENRVWDGRRVDTVAFNGLPDIKRQAWFDALDAMTRVDTLAALDYLQMHGLDVRYKNLPYYINVVGMSRPAGTSTHLRWLSFTPSTQDTTGLMMSGVSKVYACDLTLGKPMSFGAWKVSPTDVDVLYAIRDGNDVTIDTLDLSPLLEEQLDGQLGSLTSRSVTTRAGRFTFVPLSGYMSIGTERVQSFALQGIVLVR